MYIGKSVLAKHNGVVQEGKVIEIFPEDLKIELENKEVIMRKFWEIGKVKNEE